MSKRGFTYEKWDYDCDGEAFIIAKDECPIKENITGYLKERIEIGCDCEIPLSDIKEGVCKYQVRSDWEGCDGPTGGYYVDDSIKTKKGWFSVWIVRIGEWY